MFDRRRRICDVAVIAVAIALSIARNAACRKALFCAAMVGGGKRVT